MDYNDKQQVQRIDRFLSDVTRLFRGLGISMTEAQIWLALSGAEIAPTQKEICEKTGFNRRSVRPILKRLATCGYLEEASGRFTILPKGERRRNHLISEAAVLVTDELLTAFDLILASDLYRVGWGNPPPSQG